MVFFDCVKTSIDGGCGRASTTAASTIGGVASSGRWTEVGAAYKIEAGHCLALRPNVAVTSTMESEGMLTWTSAETRSTGVKDPGEASEAGGEKEEADEKKDNCLESTRGTRSVEDG